MARYAGVIPALEVTVILTLRCLRTADRLFREWSSLEPARPTGWMPPDGTGVGSPLIVLPLRQPRRRSQHWRDLRRAA
ncbi:MAG: hypothetical protein AB1758_00170 [Candidatus Eremiobacterota bacterium]